MSTPIDLAAIRDRLSAANGPTYWRSLEELAGSDAFLDYLHREFPSQASEFTDPVGRRQFLKLMAASLGLAGLTACTRMPEEPIVPYVRPPEELIPGRALFYATAMPLGGYGMPLLVESHLGRPTKVEGNPDHPLSLGATDVFAQASVLDLYDPDRAQTVTHFGEVRPWPAFIGAMLGVLAAQREGGGAGLRILTETISSPAVADQLRTILSAFPQARWHQYDPAAPGGRRAGALEAFGEAVETHYRLEEADVILSLDADFLACGPAHLRHVREFSARRRPDQPGGRGMARLYVVESSLTLTGTKADHRLALVPSQMEAFAGALADALDAGGGGQATGLPDAARERWLPAIARDLQAHRGRAVIIAGDQQPGSVHALAHAMNQALGSVGRTVVHTAPVAAAPVDHMASLGELAADMEEGRVDLLLIAGGNPVFTAPADLPFADALDRVPLRVHLSLHRNETSELCHWNIPEAHYLESWGDVRAADGSVCLIQPLIAPLYGGRTAGELLAVMAGEPERSAYDVVREYWRRTFEENGAGTFVGRNGRPFADFEAFWRASVHDGFVAGTALPPLPRTARLAPPAAAVPSTGQAAPSADGKGVEIVFRPDPTVHDGRFANNGWLQELPKPLTRVTWDNVILVAPDTAAGLGLTKDELLEVRHQDRTIRGPAVIAPGHAPGVVTVFFGSGRWRTGRVGTGTGFNAYPLRTSAAPWTARGGELRRTRERHALAVTQGHFAMEGRHLVRAGTIEQYRAHPEFVQEMGHTPPRTLTLYPEFRYEGYKWGMAIDLGACTGCNACVVACQAENNIPVVGKDQVLVGREMHWLRVDTYYEGDPAAPEAYHQPVPCMHCENAPCEVVCPVVATVHSSEGLNDMIYNRCVGTRYCSNNCPYKVRRFNFFQYADWTTETLQMQRNPDVTVRSRGVMEKCTYCVQRINHARIEAKKEDRAIRDGEVLTACQAVCPAEAIVFGDLNDPNSRVTQLKTEARNYGILEDLNTRPRTTYLAVLKNPNPELEPAGAAPRAARAR
jgi:MoCo/4Fe-4S cofactor protein with predicted Tat translocation signal